MLDLTKSVSVFAYIYFIPLIFIGAYFLLNLTLAVIKFTFSYVVEKSRNKILKRRKKLVTFNFDSVKPVVGSESPNNRLQSPDRLYRIKSDKEETHDEANELTLSRFLHR